MLSHVLTDGERRNRRTMDAALLQSQHDIRNDVGHLIWREATRRDQGNALIARAWPNAIVLSLRHVKGRIVQHLKPSVSVTVGKVPAVTAGYKDGWKTGFRMRREVDLFFAIRGNEARLAYTSAIMEYLVALDAEDCGDDSVRVHHGAFMRGWHSRLIELLREGVFYLHDWAMFSERIGLIKEFEVVVANRAFVLSKRVSRECLELTRNVCASKSMHAQA